MSGRAVQALKYSLMFFIVQILRKRHFIEKIIISLGRNSEEYLLVIASPFPSIVIHLVIVVISNRYLHCHFALFPEFVLDAIIS